MVSGVVVSAVVSAVAGALSEGFVDVGGNRSGPFCPQAESTAALVKAAKMKVAHRGLNIRIAKQSLRNEKIESKGWYHAHEHR